MRGYRGSTVGGGNVVKPPLTLRLEDTMTKGFSSSSNTYNFNYLFGDKELLARQFGQRAVARGRGLGRRLLAGRVLSLGEDLKP